MTTGLNDRKIQYIAVGGEPTFDFDFPISKSADLVVTLTSGGVILPDLVEGVDYTLVINTPPAVGGTITLIGAHAAGAVATDVWTLFGDTVIERLAGFIKLGDFFAATINAEQDKFIRIVQELDAAIDRSIAFGPSTQETTIPTLPDRIANRLLGTNALKEFEWKLAIDQLLQTVSEVDETSSDTTKDKLISNFLTKKFNDYVNVGHLQLTDVVGKNRIINGSFDIWQRGATITSPSNGDYLADRWQFLISGAAAVTVSEDASVTPNGAGSSMKVDVTTADSSLLATDFVAIQQKIEGYNIYDALFGQSGAKKVSISFKVRSPKTGTHVVALQNSDSSRSYITTYTISAADTWETKTITLTADTVGTWLGTTNTGLILVFPLAAGTNFHGTANTWAGSNLRGVSGMVNVVDNTANNFYLADVQLEIGSNATEFERRPIAQEFVLCQRYFERAGGTTAASALASGHVQSTTNSESILNFQTIKRVVPTITFSSQTGFDIRTQAATPTSTTMAAQQTGLETCIISAQDSGAGLTGGQGMILRIKTAGDFIDISAEL